MGDSKAAMAKAATKQKEVSRDARRRPNAPRQPARGRGLLRYAALVEATDILLQTESPDEVGLYRIAEQAGVPPASVYHFFPTKEAAFTALANRKADELMEVHCAPMRARDVQTWQSLFRVDAGRARDFYNRNPAALKIFYGGYGGVDALRVDETTTYRLASAVYQRMDRIFHMPFIREPARKFVCRMAILDAIWGVSVKLHGTITDDYHEEALVACIAYSRQIFPEVMELRDEFRALVESDGSITLPFQDFETGPDQPE
jgi:AcrR family transcriptional regulator